MANESTSTSKYISYIPETDMKQFAFKKVAVYARVSRETEIKHHSIEMQVKSLEKDVNNHPGWIFVGAYIDEGVTGTKMNRPAFTKMMEDARNGKIDIIITKTVSRFGRNIIAVQKVLRELKNLNVTVIFESEGISTANPDAAFSLQYLSIQAENEARQTSEYQKWAVRNRFKKGIPSFIKMYGYEMKDHQLYVVPDEAKVVKRIFQMFLSGMGKTAIIKRLNKEKIKSPHGSLWRTTTIYTILTNINYTGDLLLQKTYRTDFITKRKKINNGELPQYLVKNAHQAIIDKETFNKVQTEIARRNEFYPHQDPGSSPPKLFRHLIKCANCGAYFKYRLATGNGYERKLWVCINKAELSKSYCPNKDIPENILINITKAVLEEYHLIKLDTTLTNELLINYIDEIIAYPNQTLEFHLCDGTTTTKSWQFKSRKDSWTDEMKKKAREKALQAIAEKKKTN